MGEDRRQRREVAPKNQFARQLRRNSTDAEVRAWGLLRNRQMFGLKFRRQYPIGGFIADFYNKELRLALEIDGEIHERSDCQAYDAERDVVLSRLGVRVVRIRNEDVCQRNLERLLRNELRRFRDRGTQ